MSGTVSFTVSYAGLSDVGGNGYRLAVYETVPNADGTNNVGTASISGSTSTFVFSSVRNYRYFSVQLVSNVRPSSPIVCLYFSLGEPVKSCFRGFSVYRTF